ncbi:YcjF family protein [Synechococcus sp. PCC 6312]|uniref:YcjF family protein n=1 Tax=Synechococcus sp. (strain ATCC 27167 / PCC 6312) TaxID=195253 RepID=UPI0012EA868E|nr:DUF697 domain-containing protein [Synechococcus sp. PCC 6312]
MIRKALATAREEHGHVNILIAGRSGVGKSTLINAVFQGELASTGDGRPVTPNIREICKSGLPLSIFDSRGLEMQDFQETLGALQTFVAQRHLERNQNQHIHVAWVCIDEGLRRVEAAESELVKMLAHYLPVIAVITKARADQGFQSTVQTLLPQARNVVRVRSIPELDDDGHRKEPMGLQALVALTFDLVPEGQQRAFVAAQKVDLDLKKQQAHLIVATAAASAAAIAATPIPFADAILIVPVQVGMLASVGAVFGLPLSQSVLTTLLASLVTGAGATLMGRAIVGSALKLIPGLGVIAGGAISAGTAASVTTLFGEAYITVLESFNPPQPAPMTLP